MDKSNESDSYVINNVNDAIAIATTSDTNNGSLNYNTFDSNNSIEQASLLESYLPNFGHVHYSQRAPWLRAAILDLMMV